MYLLDTVAISALRLPRRNPAPADWLRRHQEDPVWISALTFGEIQQGIELAANPILRRELEAWLGAISAIYHDSVIPFSEDEARLWGSLVAPFQLRGRPVTLVDSMIAATALFHGLTIVTRNVRDFERFNVPVINPWQDETGA